MCQQFGEKKKEISSKAHFANLLGNGIGPQWPHVAANPVLPRQVEGGEVSNDQENAAIQSRTKIGQIKLCTC